MLADVETFTYICQVFLWGVTLWGHELHWGNDGDLLFRSALVTHALDSSPASGSQGREGKVYSLLYMANCGHYLLPAWTHGLQGWCNALIIYNAWCQNYLHTNRHFFINSPVIPSRNPWFGAKKLWWWILLWATENGFYQQTQFLNGFSVSSALPQNELCLRPLSFLPVIEFMPTLCLYTKYLPEIPLLTFLSFRVSAQHLCLCPWYLTSPF